MKRVKSLKKKKSIHFLPKRHTSSKTDHYMDEDLESKSSFVLHDGNISDDPLSPPRGSLLDLGLKKEVDPILNFSSLKEMNLDLKSLQAQISVDSHSHSHSNKKKNETKFNSELEFKSPQLDVVKLNKKKPPPYCYSPKSRNVIKKSINSSIFPPPVRDFQAKSTRTVLSIYDHHSHEEYEDLNQWSSCHGKDGTDELFSHDPLEGIIDDTHTNPTVSSTINDSTIQSQTFCLEPVPEDDGESYDDKHSQKMSQRVYATTGEVALNKVPVDGPVISSTYQHTNDHRVKTNGFIISSPERALNVVKQIRSSPCSITQDIYNVSMEVQESVTPTPLDLNNFSTTSRRPCDADDRVDGDSITFSIPNANSTSTQLIVPSISSSLDKHEEEISYWQSIRKTKLQAKLATKQRKMKRLKFISYIGFWLPTISFLAMILIKNYQAASTE